MPKSMLVMHVYENFGGNSLDKLALEGRVVGDVCHAAKTISQYNVSPSSSVTYLEDDCWVFRDRNFITLRCGGSLMSGLVGSIPIEVEVRVFLLQFG